MSHSGYAVPSFPPPHEMVDALVARVLDVLAASFQDSPDALRARVGPALEVCLEDHVRALEERLLRAERLANVGQLSAGVAHELRNPLSVIETSVFILGERLTEDPRAQRHLRRIADQVGIATEIVNDLLETARDRPIDRADMDLTAAVRDAVGQVPRAPEIVLDMDLPAGLPRIHADARRLRQVFVNLLTNAFQALAIGGRTVVTASASGHRVTVAIRDHGPGIPPELLPRLFEPLVSTRLHGVGLGLAISRRIVEAHGGTLTAANAAGGGAVFTVSLPAVQPSPTTPVTPVTPA